jgi:hypothetical protein
MKKSIGTIAMQFNFIKLAHDLKAFRTVNQWQDSGEYNKFHQAVIDEGYEINTYDLCKKYVLDKCLESFCSAFPLDKPRQ